MKTIFISLLFFLTVFNGVGQVTIKGVIVDENVEPLPGVNVTIKGTAIGALTAADGKFSITLDSADIAQLDTANLKLVVSYIGFSNTEFDANRENVIQLNESLVMSTGPDEEPLPKKKFTVFKVFYGTDRKSEVADGEISFTGDRGKQVTYGACTISVPYERSVGSIPEPSFWKFEFRRDPDKHFVLQKNETLSKTEFVSSINQRLSKTGKNAFIFIHGYNVSFYDAALRTAQMAKDLNFDGVPIFYSWPSKASFSLYGADESTIAWSQPYIKEFIRDVALQSKADNIYLIGHSMGTRALTNALVSLIEENPDVRKKIREVILAAPDIEVDLFVRDNAPKIISSKCNMTLYASTNDLALKASNIFHAFPRLGQSGPDLVVINGIETIDASGIGSTDLFGHSYFADTGEILRDMYYLLQKGQRATQRTWLQKKTKLNVPYWIFGVPPK